MHWPTWRTSAWAAVIVLAGVLCLRLPPIQARLMRFGPDVMYYGYAVSDRWGQKPFQTGQEPLFFFTDDAFAKLADKANQPIGLAVLKWDLEFIPGPVAVKAISEAAVKPLMPGVSLQVASETHTVPQGKGLPATITLTNGGDAPVALDANRFALVMVSNRPVATWYYESMGSPMLAREVAVARHEFLLHWKPATLVSAGKGVYARIGMRVEVEPGGSFSVSLPIGRSTPPGEYQAFVYYGSSGFSQPAGPMSERLDFDIVD